jgi:GDP-4-dehydro-6-deoxy-D-mannose reductase
MTGKVLITGVCGFCARHLVKRLSAEGVSNIHGADMYPFASAKLSVQSYYKMDITKESEVNELVRSIRPDVVFHMAGVNKGNPSEIYQINLLGSVYLLEAIRKFAPQSRVLMVGSAAEYGHIPEVNLPVRESDPCKPVGPYGIAKYAMTLTALDYVRNHSLKVVVARPFNIVGEGINSSLLVGEILGRVKKSLKEGGKPVTVAVGNLETERDFVAVGDVIDAYITLMQGDYWGEVFNICSGKPRSVRSVLELLLANSATPVHLEVDPVLVRPTDTLRSFGSIDKGRRYFGFVPKVPIRTVLKAAWDEAMG